MNNLQLFDFLLEEDGIRSHKNYTNAISGVLKRNNINFKSLVKNITFYIYSYTFGENKEFNYGKGTVSAALKKIKYYFSDFSYTIRIKVFDENFISYYEYLNCGKEINNFNILFDQYFRINNKINLFNLEEIRYGCNEFFIVLSRISEFISVCVFLEELYNLFHKLKKILKGHIEIINNLNQFEIKILHLLISLIKKISKNKEVEIKINNDKTIKITNTELIEIIQNELEKSL